MARVPCDRCGVDILEATHRNNDGLCMPCKKGWICSACGKSTLSGMLGMCSDCARQVPKPKERTEFDVDQMTRASVQAILEFSQKHRDETFYGFAVDANMLCLNSLEAFEKTLQEYSRKYPAYQDDEARQMRLKMNAGDWEYQGFYSLSDSDGFCDPKYQDHYCLASDDPSAASTSDYAQAMNALIERLTSSDVFDSINTTDDFAVQWVDHDY